MKISRIIFSIIIMALLYTGTNFYIAKRLFQWLGLLFSGINGKVYAVIYICIAVSMFLGFAPVPSGIRRVFGGISSYWMGLFLYLLMFFVAADLIVLIGHVVRLIPFPVPHAIRFASGLAVILLTTGLVSYGIYNGNQEKFVSYNVGVNGKNPVSDMKIVLVSDLHLGAVNSENRLPKIVEGINKLKPDIVCIAGDIFNSSNVNALHNPSGAIDLLKSIKSVYGVYACPGNHDAGRNITDMLQFLRQSNITLLNEEYVTIDNRLVLAGRLDSSPIGGFGGLHRKNIADILASADTSLPVVVMDHNPANIGQYSNPVDLILCGHTHRGQIFPANLMTWAMYTVDYGYYRKDSKAPQVIVTSGAGTWGPPLRVGTNNEIVSIDVRSAGQ